MQHRPIKTILVIEDDRFIGEMYVRSLVREGYAVDWVVTGTQGFAAATSKQYDLILLDIMLPEAQGTDVLTQLRSKENDRIPHSRVLILTNFEQDDESRFAMQAQADGYLIKAEITPRKLIDIIKQMSA
ncbi:MAG: response regulator [Candidatus Saccharimonadales bacterium]